MIIFVKKFYIFYLIFNKNILGELIMNGFLKINDVLDVYYVYMVLFDILWYFFFLFLEIRIKFVFYRCIVMYININYDWVC